MQYEFDEIKSQANKAKHGVDFVEAQEVFTDSKRITGPGDVTEGETRWLTVGMAKGKLITVCWTERLGTTRIISARAARREEKEAYG